MDNFKEYIEPHETRELQRLKRRYNRAIDKMFAIMQEINSDYKRPKLLEAKRNCKIIDRERHSIVVRLMIRQENYFKNNIKQAI